MNTTTVSRNRILSPKLTDAKAPDVSEILKFPVEKVRFNPNVMFQLEADKKTIQHSIDTLILNKFQ